MGREWVVISMFARISSHAHNSPPVLLSGWPILSLTLSRLVVVGCRCLELLCGWRGRIVLLVVVLLYPPANIRLVGLIPFNNVLHVLVLRRSSRYVSFSPWRFFSACIVLSPCRTTYGWAELSRRLPWLTDWWMMKTKALWVAKWLLVLSFRYYYYYYYWGYTWNADGWMGAEIAFERDSHEQYRLLIGVVKYHKGSQSQHSHLMIIGNGGGWEWKCSLYFHHFYSEVGNEIGKRVAICETMESIF